MVWPGVLAGRACEERRRDGRTDQPTVASAVMRGSRRVGIGSPPEGQLLRRHEQIRRGPFVAIVGVYHLVVEFKQQIATPEVLSHKLTFVNLVEASCWGQGGNRGREPGPVAQAKKCYGRARLARPVFVPCLCPRKHRETHVRQRIASDKPTRKPTPGNAGTLGDVPTWLRPWTGQPLVGESSIVAAIEAASRSRPTGVCDLRRAEPPDDGLALPVVRRGEAVG
jgi:hypothetical protein